VVRVLKLPTQYRGKYESLLAARTDALRTNAQSAKVELVPIKEEIDRLLSEFVADQQNSAATGVPNLAQSVSVSPLTARATGASARGVGVGRGVPEVRSATNAEWAGPTETLSNAGYEGPGRRVTDKSEFSKQFPAGAQKFIIKELVNAKAHGEFNVGESKSNAAAAVSALAKYGTLARYAALARVRVPHNKESGRSNPRAQVSGRYAAARSTGGVEKVPSYLDRLPKQAKTAASGVLGALPVPGGDPGA